MIATLSNAWPVLFTGAFFGALVLAIAWVLWRTPQRLP